MTFAAENLREPHMYESSVFSRQSVLRKFFAVYDYLEKGVQSSHIVCALFNFMIEADKLDGEERKLQSLAIVCLNILDSSVDQENIRMFPCLRNVSYYNENV